MCRFGRTAREMLRIIVLWFGPAKPELYQAVIAECFHTTDYSKRDCWVADRLPDARMKSVPNAIGHCMRNVE